MEILYKEPIMEMAQNYKIAALVILMIGIISFAILLCADRWSVWVPIGGFSTVICFIVLAGIVLGAPQVETGRYQYTALIDDDTPFVEVSEKYEVEGANGKVWTLKDKETDE